jgi:hypothetical protein
MDDENDLSPFEIIALKARQVGLGGEPVSPRLRMVSFRLPLQLLASVDALASITAQSRNTTMIDLLNAAVSGVIDALDDPQQFHEAREHFLTQLTGE